MHSTKEARTNDHEQMHTAQRKPALIHFQLGCVPEKIENILM